MEDQTARKDLRRVRGFLRLIIRMPLGGRLCPVSPERQYAYRVVLGTDGVDGRQAFWVAVCGLDRSVLAIRAARERAI
jgi:hypothetical protein